MAKGNSAGDIVVERIKSRARLTGQSTEALLKRYVLERALYRLAEAYGPRLMLKGSMVAMIDDPETARPAPDVDIHLKHREDIEMIVPDLLTRTYYDSNSPTGLVEDHVVFSRFRVVPLQHSEGAGVKFRIEAMLGLTRVNVAIDFGFGHGAVTAMEVKRIPAMFKGLPPVFVSCQPVADAMADKLRAMMETYGKDSEIGACPVCVTEAYAERHQPTWESWLKKSGLKDSRSLADVVQEIRQPVEAACRAALRLRARVQAPGLRLVSSR